MPIVSNAPTWWHRFLSCCAHFKNQFSRHVILEKDVWPFTTYYKHICHDNIPVNYFQKCTMDNTAYEHDLRHYNNNTKDAEVGCVNKVDRTIFRIYFISRQGKKFHWVKRRSRLRKGLSTRMFFSSLFPFFFSLWLLSPCPSFNPQLMWWV